MVEQWSSKSYVWVRFLLPLLKKTYKNLKFNKKQILINFFKKSKNKKLFNNKLLTNFFLTKNAYLSFKKNKRMSTSPFIVNFNKYFFSINSFFFHENLKKKSFQLWKINKNYFTVFNSFFNKNLSLFFYSFFSLKQNSSFFYINFINNKNNTFIYYYFYINSLNFLLKSISENFFKEKNLQNLYIFNFNRFNTTNTLFQKKISNCSFKKIRILLLNFFKNKQKIFWRKKIKNTIFVKTLVHLKYFFLSKNYFNNFNISNKLINVFKLSHFDWVNENLARLTRDSIRINLNENFSLKNSNFFNSNFKQLSLITNNFNTNDSFFENNLFFIKNKTFNRFFSLNKFNANLFLFQQTSFSNQKLLKNNNIKTSIFYKFNNNNKNFYLTNPIISNFNNFYLFNKFEILFFFYFKPIFFKYIFLISNKLKTSHLDNFFNLNTYVSNFFFYSKNNFLNRSNILPDNTFSFIFRKKMLKVFNYNKFPTITTVAYYNSLIRFIEFCSGKKVYIKFHTFLNNTLSFQEKAQCLLWSQKVKYFRKVLGPRLFLNESLQIIYLALKLKDPYMLSNWIVSTMQKISFWKYKTFLRYIKYVLRYFFWVIFKQLNIKGIKFQLKGKISVAGNARTRTVFHNVGFTSHTTFNNKILYKLNLVRTFTGVLGLKLWIVF